MEYLALNIGSSSKKYTFRNAEGVTIHKTVVRRHDGCFWEESAHERYPMSEEDYAIACTHVINELVRRNVTHSDPSTWTYALRLVVPGSVYAEDRDVDDAFLEQLARDRVRDPVHIDPVYAECAFIRSTYPTARIRAISDSAFHRTMPECARRVALPGELRERYDLQRFGYHGLSLASIVRQLRAQELLRPRTVVCHLGSGASVTALSDGASIETSMGYAPLEGIPMSTRSGDMPLGALLELARTLSPEELSEILYTQSGLQALSGYTNDMENLVNDYDTHPGAQAAIDTFVYQIVRSIGSSVSVLGGLDAVVFSGGIGERSDDIRARVCTRLKVFGVRLDPQRNSAAAPYENLATPTSAVHVCYATPREEDELFIRVGADE